MRRDNGNVVPIQPPPDMSVAGWLAGLMPALFVLAWLVLLIVLIVAPAVVIGLWRWAL